jgi:5-oxopent-3-ene-1,2,5-tricarboxylate decarboxylase/2-hydroxyhepta-2,4-diene-1,7-dioate isomerase
VVPALLALRGNPQPIEARVEPAENAVTFDGRRVEASDLEWEVPAIGCVYGAALNFRGLLDLLEPEFHRPPYDRPPSAPVLYIKPRNTWLAHRRPVPLPAGVDEVEIGATLGVLMARDATRVPRGEGRRLDRRLHDRQRRDDPAHRALPAAAAFQMPDGFCPVGPWVVPRDAMPSPDALAIRAWVNGELRMQNTTANLHRDIAALIADITEFMTLRAGDLLAVGVPEHPALARAGDLMTVEIEGLGRLENALVLEDSLAAEIPS